MTIGTIYSTIFRVMTKREKRVRKIFRNPKTVPFEELNRVLQDFGFDVRQPKSGSSHYIFTKGELQISVPYKRPFVREVYVKRVLELIGEPDEKKS